MPRQVSWPSSRTCWHLVVLGRHDQLEAVSTLQVADDIRNYTTRIVDPAGLQLGRGLAGVIDVLQLYAQLEYICFKQDRMHEMFLGSCEAVVAKRVAGHLGPSWLAGSRQVPTSSFVPARVASYARKKVPARSQLSLPLSSLLFPPSPPWGAMATLVPRPFLGS